MDESRTCTTCAELMLENSKLHKENIAMRDKKSVIPFLRDIGSLVAAPFVGIWRFVAWCWPILLVLAFLASIISIVVLGIRADIRGEKERDRTNAARSAAEKAERNKAFAEAAKLPELTLVDVIDKDLDGRRITDWNDDLRVVELSDRYWYRLSKMIYDNCKEESEHTLRFSLSKVLIYMRNSVRDSEECKKELEKLNLEPKSEPDHR